MSNWEETPEKTQDMMERLSLLTGLEMHMYCPEGAEGGDWGQGIPAQIAAPVTCTRIMTENGQMGGWMDDQVVIQTCPQTQCLQFTTVNNCVLFAVFNL